LVVVAAAVVVARLAVQCDSVGARAKESGSENVRGSSFGFGFSLYSAPCSYFWSRLDREMLLAALLERQAASGRSHTQAEARSHP